MSEARHYPTVRRRRLATELKRLRLACDLTGEQAAKALAKMGGTWSYTKVSRIETGNVGVLQRDVADMCTVYGLTEGPLRDELIRIAGESGKKGLWQQYVHVLGGQHYPYLDIESSARTISSAQSSIIHGLLQTDDYARAIILTGNRAEKADQMVALRKARRQTFFESADKRHLWAIMDEAVLRRLVGGPEVMAAQLSHLVEMSRHPRVTLQVLPFGAGAHSAMDSPFSIIKFIDESFPAVVYLESMAGAIYLEEEDETDEYTMYFDHLRAAAISPPDSVRLISAM